MEELKEEVARIIYDWLHENQVTHRKDYYDRPADQREQYRTVAQRIIDVIKAREDQAV